MSKGSENECNMEYTQNERWEEAMNVRKIFGLLAVILILSLISCGGGKYDDWIEVNSDLIDAMEKYAVALEKASSAKAVADATNRYADKIKALAPKIKELRNKYPEINDPDKLPAKLKDLEKKAENLQQKLSAGFMNMMKYMMDPDVQKAHERLQAAMMTME